MYTILYNPSLLFCCFDVLTQSEEVDGCRSLSRSKLFCFLNLFSTIGSRVFVGGVVERRRIYSNPKVNVITDIYMYNALQQK